MNIKLSMLALAVLAVPLMGSATAGDVPDESVLTLDFSPAGGKTMYLHQDGKMYEETNEWDGLQTSIGRHGKVFVESTDARLL